VRILLTGASGFVGSYLLRRILQSGEHEVAILRQPGDEAWRIRDLLDRVQVLEGDLAETGTLKPQLTAFGPGAVLHLAWAGVLGSQRNDARQVENMNWTLALVKLAYDVGAQHWIGLGSQAEYGAQTQAIDERSPTAPTTLYGMTKLRSGLMAGRLCQELGLRFAWLRLFSTYGPQNDPAWMLPYVILALLAGERPSLTPAEQLWDFLYVGDAAEAIYAVLCEPRAEGVFNLGCGKAVVLRQVVEQVRDLIDPRLPLGFGEVSYRPDQVMHLEADITRLKQATGWAPLTGLAEGLARTVEWYREHRSETVNR
jgi:nucleoside-diphosphate-sugar epimerase